MKIEHYLFLNKNNNKNIQPKMAAVTHKNCPDGAAAALLLKLIFPDITIFHSAHNKIDEECLRLCKNGDEGSGIIIVDIAPAKEVVDTIIQVATEKKMVLCIYDHHESTKWLTNYADIEEDNIEIIFDSSRCGCKIVYDRYLPSHAELLSGYEEFIEVSNDRDLWLQRHKKSDELAILHQILGDVGFIKRFKENKSMTFDEKEKQLLQYSIKLQKQNHEKLLKRMRIKKDENGFRYGVIFGEGESSNLLNTAIERNNLEYAILVNLHTKQGSIRGKGNFNCAAFAEKYGGGGHKCASGFRVKVNLPNF